jgi:hypothetical protein
LGKKYLGKRCLYYECEKWRETNNHIQYGPRHDEHLTNFLFIPMIGKINLKNKCKKKPTWILIILIYSYMKKIRYRSR